MTENQTTTENQFTVAGETFALLLKTEKLIDDMHISDDLKVEKYIRVAEALTRLNATVPEYFVFELPETEEDEDVEEPTDTKIPTINVFNMSAQKAAEEVATSLLHHIQTKCFDRK